MNLEDCIRLIDKLDVIQLKIKSTNGYLFCVIKEEKKEFCIAQLKEIQDILCKFRRVTIIGATKNIVKQSWRDAYQWQIKFTLPKPTPHKIYLKDLDLSIRLQNAIHGLVAANKDGTLQDICKYSLRDYMRTRGFGTRCRKELIALLQTHNLELNKVDQRQ